MSSAVPLSAIPTVAARFSKHADPGSFLSLISIWRGDITRLQVDAIVNAANNTLLGGGGVDGAIHKAAGPRLLAECRLLNGCEAGQAKITGGYELEAKHVIHTVGPVGEQRALLASAYRACLDVARANGVRTIAFPCVSTGVYGYPAEKACRVVLPTVQEWLSNNRGAIDRIVFCMYNDKSVAVYESVVADDTDRSSRRYSVTALYSIVAERDEEVSDELSEAQRKLRELKGHISAQSKKNFLLERDVRYLDSRIALLIQNRMAADEVKELS
ncbi:O-acetyl-ADP-ribose deacetylase macrod2, partial [Kickxella alabastrina]